MRRSLVLCIVLSACGVGGNNITQNGTFVPPEQTVTVPGVTGPVRLGGRMETSRRFIGIGTRPNHTITITLAGEEAGHAAMETYAGGTVAGRWRGMPVVAACTAHETAKATRRFDCPVLVDSRPVGALSFHAWARGSGPPAVVLADIRN